MAAVVLKHVMTLEICKDKPWSAVTAFVLNCELNWPPALTLWWDARRTMSHDDFPPTMQNLPAELLDTGIFRKGERIQIFEGEVKAFCNYGNIHLGKMTSAQSFLLRTNEHIQRAPESVGHGRHWLICVIKKEGDLWIILLFSNMFPRLTVSLKKGFCFNQIYMLVVWLSQDTWGKFKCTTYIKSRLWPSQKSALKGEISYSNKNINRKSSQILTKHFFFFWFKWHILPAHSSTHVFLT